MLSVGAMMMAAAANSLKPNRDEFEVFNPQFKRRP
jgi:hypothetical protein